VLNREPGQSGFEVVNRANLASRLHAVSKRSDDEIRAGGVAKAIAFAKNEGRGGSQMLF
jgi:hypothetical protein